MLYIVPNNIYWSILTDCSGTLSAPLCLTLPTVFFMFNGDTHSVVLTKEEMKSLKQEA